MKAPRICVGDTIKVTTYLELPTKSLEQSTKIVKMKTQVYTGRVIATHSKRAHLKSLKVDRFVAKQLMLITSSFLEKEAVSSSMDNHLSGSDPADFLYPFYWLLKCFPEKVGIYEYNLPSKMLLKIFKYNLHVLLKLFGRDWFVSPPYRNSLFVWGSSVEEKTLGDENENKVRAFEKIHNLLIRYQQNPTEDKLMRNQFYSTFGTTITVRKMLKGDGRSNRGCEKIFLLDSPWVKDIDIVSSAKVRRSKLYFLRQRTGKGAKLKPIVRT
jgi:ribosomal protein L19